MGHIGQCNGKVDWKNVKSFLGHAKETYVRSVCSFKAMAKETN